MATSSSNKILLPQKDTPSLVRVGYHAAFWMVLLLILLLIDMAMFDGIKSWGLEIISLSFFGIIVYFNLLYLIPNYLSKERFLTYIGLLIATALVLSSLRVVFYFIHFNNDPTIQAHALEANLALYLPLTITIAGGSTILKIITDWFRQLREKQELATQTMQSELRFLKSQINPHFLFNTLNNLYALTLKKSDKAPEIVIKLSEMMRYMLYECNEKRVPLQKEVNYLRNYLDLERLRQNDDIEINFLVEGRVGNQQVAPLLFIPFLENSFKHGLNTQLADGFVNILLSVDEKMVDFQIENSKGQTVLRPDNRPSGGIGLVNVRRRLDLLYPNRYELKVSNNPNTFSVHLTVNLD